MASNTTTKKRKPRKRRSAKDVAAELRKELAQVRKQLRAAQAEAEMSVVDAVKRDLDLIAKKAPELAESGIAVSALSLAREVDDRQNSSTSRATFARALLDTLARLRELAPTEEEGDSLDELSARRASRRARAAGSKG